MSMNLNLSKSSLYLLMCLLGLTTEKWSRREMIGTVFAMGHSINSDKLGGMPNIVIGINRFYYEIELKNINTS